MAKFPDPASFDHIELTADIVSACLSNNRVQVVDVPGLIAGVHAALTGLGGATEPSGPEKPTPAQIRESITHEALTRLIHEGVCWRGFLS